MKKITRRGVVVDPKILITDKEMYAILTNPKYVIDVEEAKRMYKMIKGED